MDTVSIRWTGPERELPGLGVVRQGDLFEADEKTARSFLAQGLAETCKAKGSQKKTTPAKGEEG